MGRSAVIIPFGTLNSVNDDFERPEDLLKSRGKRVCILASARQLSHKPLFAADKLRTTAPRSSAKYGGSSRPAYEFREPAAERDEIPENLDRRSRKFPRSVGQQEYGVDAGFAGGEDVKAGIPDDAALLGNETQPF